MYKTLFETSDYWQDLMISKSFTFLFMVAFTILLIFLFIREMKKFSMTLKQKINFGFLIVVFCYFDYIYLYSLLAVYHDKDTNPYALYKKGKCTHIEGVIHDYKVIGNMDYFYVKDVKFEINLYTSYPPEAFFAKRKANFSPLKDGVMVKMCYLPNSTLVENAIVKLEYNNKS